MWKSSLSKFHRWRLIAAVTLASVAFVLVFHRTFYYLYTNWQREEYSHGFLIPPICVFLLWQRRRLFRRSALSGSWSGVPVVVLGLLLLYLDSGASIVSLDAYALVIVIAGCAVAMIGWPGFRLALVPIALLLLMVPLPTFWYNNLSSQLELISSRIGVGLIRACGVPVFLEGNVIELATHKLQVAEACSGLRYLFPLMTLGVVVAYMFKGRIWTRWVIFLSTIPISVVMNSLRIGIIGLLVVRFGGAQAEGFMHQFEGWVIFMVCIALLLAECALLLRISGDRRALREVLGLEGSSRLEIVTRRPIRRAPRSFNLAPRPFRLGGPAAAAAGLLLLAVYPALALPKRVELKPARSEFSQFPLQLADWVGRRARLEPVFLDELKLDDYLLADYVSTGVAAETAGTVAAGPVNLYVAYYASQRSGHSVHSPGACLPAGGWHMQALDQQEVTAVRLRGAALRVNRAVIQKGAERELVYYWFQERGRDLTNEYLVKWYQFTDALTLNRSDGALVRVITPLREGEDPTVGDARLSRFSATMLPELQKYLGS